VGEEKRRKRTHAKILEAHPLCIYCGGQRHADTIEHMPPIAMFEGRRRPKGFEFPTCRECNNGTSDSDQVASLLGRVYPDAESEQGRHELKRLLKGVSNNVPGLLEEMHVGHRGQKFERRDIPGMPSGAGVLRANGPILTQHMRVFGAKLGLAFHFEAHKSPVPIAGGVQPMYFTNVNAAKGELPMDLISLLPTPQTLRQGTWEVSSQFQCSWRVTEEGRHSVFYAVFRSSFAVAAVTALDRTEFLERNADRYPVVIPGEFRSATAP
jgi:hypothetical protein